MKYEGPCPLPREHEGPCGVQGRIITYAVRVCTTAIEETINEVLPQTHPAFHDLRANTEHWEMVCDEVDRIIGIVRAQCRAKREQLGD